MIWEPSTEMPSISTSSKILLVYGVHKPGDLSAMNTVLSKDELDTARKLKVESQRNTWISCHVALRRILGDYLGIHPIEIELNKNHFGKLFLADSKLFFNLSHTHTSFLIGFDTDAKIGVDLEYLSGNEDLSSLIDYAFTEEEGEYCVGENLPEHFLEIWTLKEAFLKATGVGLVNDLKSINVIGNSKNEIFDKGFNKSTFICPNGETASIIFRNELSLTAINLT